MKPRVITESYEAGSITVDVQTDHCQPYVSVNAFECGVEEPSLLYLTRDEVDDLIDALKASLAEIDAAHLNAVRVETTALLGRPAAFSVEDPGPDDMTEPDEPIGNVHGGNYYRSAAVIDALRRARDELLANSTPVGGEL